MSSLIQFINSVSVIHNNCVCVYIYENFEMYIHIYIYVYMKILKKYLHD
jgi:hypothetical protein